MSPISQPPLYGQRLIPVFIDETAKSSPSKLFCQIPRAKDLKSGFKDVTYADFARSINRGAAWLEENFGRSESFDTLAYIGPFDLRYFIVLIAAGKIGFKTLLPSPRNSLEGQLNLFKLTDTKAILSPKGYPISPELINDSDLKVTRVPELNELLAPGEVQVYAYTKTFDEAKLDPYVVLHTSGSTGLPKPVELQHGWFSSVDKQNDLPDLGAHRGLWPGLRNRSLFTVFPPFHAGGLNLTLLCPLWLDTVIIWAPATIPASAVMVDEILSIIDVDVMYIAPSMLKELVQLPSTVTKLEKLSTIGYGGGPLATAVGSKLCSKTLILNTLGSTEICASPLYLHDPEDWEYFHYNPIHKGIEFRPIGDGTYEQVLVRHPSTDKYHSAWWTFPELSEYSMKDLYIPHPTKENLWLYVGRADDIIVLSNGEKLNPVSMEGTLNAIVKGALVVGQGRFSPAMIIELSEEVIGTLQTAEQRAKFMEEVIWPLVVEANKSAPAHAQLSLDRIILSSVEKPFLRAGKGTIQRQATVKLYAEEIDELYQHSEVDEFAVADLHRIDVALDTGSLEIEIGKLFTSILGAKGLTSNQDFFNAGMDSLHVMRAVKQLKAAVIGVPPEKISTRLVYSNSTTSTLVAALKDMADLNTPKTGAGSKRSRELEMEEILTEVLSQLPVLSTMKKTTAPESPFTVLLTGSTGSLGTYLLHTLLSSPMISKVYCLNRRSNAEEQQTKSYDSRGLVSNWENRVEFLHVDLSKPSLGLEESIYHRLKDDTSLIIHNQWQVDFNLSLTSFNPHIIGTLNLIKLSFESPNSPRIVFTSSIGTVGNWAAGDKTQAVPEIPLADPNMPTAQGYSESKWISERLLDEAGKKSGVSSTVLRVGQIAGPIEIGAKGVWNKTEWLPSIIASSKYLGVIPETLPGQDEIAWIPVDILSKIILELIEEDVKDNQGPSTNYYHLINPLESTWRNLVPVVQEYYSTSPSGNHEKRQDIKTVSFDEWVAKLGESIREKDIDYDKNPAVKLLEFYQGLSQGLVNVKLDTKKTKERSQTMRGLQSVNEEWMKLWLERWEF